MEYVWSDNEDNWYESLEDLIDMMDLQEGDFVYKGEKSIPSHSEFIDTRWVIEQLQCSVYDNYGEYADDYLCDVTKEEEKELEELIFKWLKKFPITFYGVKNIKKYKITKKDLE